MNIPWTRGTITPQAHVGLPPGTVEEEYGARATEEIAVMLDTRRPLRVLEAMTPAEHADYWKSWRSA